MYSEIDTYFEFENAEKARAALARVPQLLGIYSSFSRVKGASPNSNETCLRIDFVGHIGDLPLVAEELGAAKVTQSFWTVWEKPSTKAASA